MNASSTTRSASANRTRPAASFCWLGLLQLLLVVVIGSGQNSWVSAHNNAQGVPEQQQQQQPLLLQNRQPEPQVQNQQQQQQQQPQERRRNSDGYGLQQSNVFAPKQQQQQQPEQPPLQQDKEDVQGQQLGEVNEQGDIVVATARQLQEQQQLLQQQRVHRRQQVQVGGQEQEAFNNNDLLSMDRICTAAVERTGGLLQQEICRCQAAPASVAAAVSFDAGNGAAATKAASTDDTNSNSTSTATDDDSTVVSWVDMTCVPQCPFCSYGSCGLLLYTERFAVRVSASTGAVTQQTLEYKSCFTFVSGPASGGDDNNSNSNVNKSQICRETNLTAGTCALAVNGESCASCRAISCTDMDARPRTPTAIRADCTNLDTGVVFDYCNMPDMAVSNRQSPFIVLDTNFDLTHCSSVSASTADTMGTAPSVNLKPQSGASSSSSLLLLNDNVLSTVQHHVVAVVTVLGIWIAMVAF